MSNLQLAFLISLPRSGSTLLQKMLAVSPQMCTVAEPWINLPLAAMADREMVIAEYWQATCAQAIDDFAAELPGGRDEFLEATANYVRGLYGSIAAKTGASVFLDKTPRYYMILPFLGEVFPDARFIFLMRSPLDVLQSILNTWHRRRIGPDLKGNLVDIANGPRQLAEGITLLRDRARVVHYNQLVANPKEVLGKLCAYIGVDYKHEMLSEYRKVAFAGRMGDPAGIESYEIVSAGSMGKRHASIGSRFRRLAARRYVRYLGNDVLRSFGSDTDTLMAQVNAASATWRGTANDSLGYLALRIAITVNQWAIGTGRRFLKRRKRGPVLPYG